MIKLLKIISLFMLAIVLLVAGLAGCLYWQRDKIIQQFISTANKNLNTPVTISKVEISAYDNFPLVSLVFHNVLVEDSFAEPNALARFKEITFSIDALEAWKGNYEVKGLRLYDGKLYVKINEQGEENFRVLKESGEKKNKVSFRLSDILLANFSLELDNQKSHCKVSVFSEKYKAVIENTPAGYQLAANGKLLCEDLTLNNQSLWKGKTINTQLTADFDADFKNIKLSPSTIDIETSGFAAEGSYISGQPNTIDFLIKGNSTTWQTLLSLLPKDKAAPLQKYDADGKMHFSMRLRGKMDEQHRPGIVANFGFQEATFTHKETGIAISKAKLTGVLESPKGSDWSQATLKLSDITGSLKGQSFQSHLTLKNFYKPQVDFSFVGVVDGTLANLLLKDSGYEAKGFADVSIALIGDIEKLKSKATVQQVKIEGSVTLDSVTFNFDKKGTISNLNGKFIFNNNDLILQQASGMIGQNDFQLNGSFKNIAPYLLFDNQPVGIDAQLKARHLNLEEFFAFAFGGKTSSPDFKFQISPLCQIKFQTDIQSLVYKKFRAKKLKGLLQIRNQIAGAHRLEFESMGGSVSLNGIADAGNPREIPVDISFGLKGICLDSAFAMFDNFHQSLIEARHLKGRVFTEGRLNFEMDDAMKWNPASVTAHIPVTIKNGELNHFEPMQKLNRFLDDETLSKLRFADLKNEISIGNQIIRIPEMEILSNATVIQLSGTHSFSQQIDYRIVAPLRPGARKKIDPDEAFGAIEEDQKGRTKIFLKITGSTDKYEVSLDKSAMKTKWRNDLKKESKELIEAFKNKPKEKKTLEVEKGDYFDWEDDKKRD